MARKQGQGSGSEPEPLVALETRHVFLDTQVYRKFGHNPTNPALKLIQQHVAAQRLVLHTTDITLLEVRRQIRELVVTRQQELAKLEKDLARWRKSAPGSAPSAPVAFDATSLATELHARFARFLVSACGAHVHKAMTASAPKIFERYFARQAPFDVHDSKEFPDAFVLEVLEDWCAAQPTKMHVVTEDQAMGRAVDESDALIHIRNIHDLLARAGADFGAEGEQAAEEALRMPDFDYTFETALRSQMGEVVFLYSGDLAEGEAYQGTLLGVNAVMDNSVVWLSEERVSLILDVDVRAVVEVQYEDRSDAFYDKEDDVWFGAETTTADIESDLDLKVFVEIERSTGLVLECRVLTSEVAISEPRWDDLLG